MAADESGNIFAISGNGDTDGSTNFGEIFSTPARNNRARLRRPRFMRDITVPIGQFITTAIS